MELTRHITKQFADITNPQDSSISDTTYGTIVDSGGTLCVKIDGSDEVTPIISTVDIKANDRVIVTIRNHNAIVTSNLTDPSVGTEGATQISESVSNAHIETYNNEIRLWVEDKEKGLRSEISIKADEILSTVNDSIAGVKSSIKQNADSIEMIVEDQEDFSKFQQTVEGFAFMNKGGTVKISKGSISLTGSITWADLDSDVQDSIENAGGDTTEAEELAATALSKAESAEEAAAIARQLAESVQLPSYLQSTYIDSTTVISPTIIGGSFYAVGQESLLQMTSVGYKVYTNDIYNPKAELNNYDTMVEFVLGAGTPDSLITGRFFITKMEDQTKLFYMSRTTNTPVGFIFNDDGTITVQGTLIT